MEIRSQDIETMKKRAGEAARFLKQLASPVRLLILCNLVEGEKCVGELEQEIGVSQSALSQHLARLRNESLVQTRREGVMVYYSIQDTRVAKVLELLHGMYCK